MIPKAAILLVIVLAMTLVPASQTDATSDFRVSYESIPQDELGELLGEGYLDSMNRYVLETVGINVSGDDHPEIESEASNISFGLDLNSDDITAKDAAKKQMETKYTYYLEYDLSVTITPDGSGYDAFDESVTGNAFPFEEYSSDDTGKITGHVRLKIDVDTRETATKQQYADVYAINSSTMIRTTAGLVDLKASFVHNGLSSNTIINGKWDVRSVTVSDFIYPDEDEGIRPGDEVYCRWSSREDSADVSVRFQSERGNHEYIRDIGDCSSGTSHGAVPDSFFQNASETAVIDSYKDSISGPLKEFSRGELSSEYMRDDGLDPYAAPELVQIGLWQPVMSLIAAAVFILIAISKMHEGMFRY